MKHLTLLILVLITGVAHAKTKVDVSISNQAKAGPCNMTEPWKKGLEEAIKAQLVTALNEAQTFTIVEPELFRAEQRDAMSGVTSIHKKRTFKAAQYSIEGALKTFDVCEGKNQEAEVVLEIKVINVAENEVEHKFTVKGVASEIASKTDASFKGAPFNSGIFKDAPLGQATRKAITAAAEKLKSTFPERDIATNGYAVKTIRKPRR